MRNFRWRTFGFALIHVLLQGCGGQGVLVPEGAAERVRSPAELLALQKFWTREAVGEALVVANGIPDRPETELLRIHWNRGKAWCGDVPLEPPRPGMEPRRWSEWIALATPPGIFESSAGTRSRWLGNQLILEGSPRRVLTFRDRFPVAVRLELESIRISVAMLAYS